MSNATFHVDEGGIYDLSLDGDGSVVLAVGTSTGIAYTSDQHSVKITGKVRSQKTGRGWTVLGQRAVFTLDNGEELVEMRGVYQTRW